MSESPALQGMRTTVDLPPALHERVRGRARSRGLSISATVAELTLRGLATQEEPLKVRTGPATGFPVMALGRWVTGADVADALDDA